MATATWKAGGVDSDGFHRIPRSTCHRASVVYMRRDAHRYVQVTSDDHMADVLALSAPDLKCGRCNGRLSVEGSVE